MKQTAEANINNLYQKYQNYDNEKFKYSFDMKYSTLHAKGDNLKARKQVGADTFMKHVNELLENYKGVQSIIVTDYGGTNPKAVQINTPVVIELMDVQIPKLMPKETDNGKHGFDILQGLAGLFHGTEFEGLGNLAPVAKLIDDKHSLDRLREKNEELHRRISELEQNNAVLSDKYDTLNRSHEQLQYEADDMEGELDNFRNRDKKQDKWVSMIGMAGASMAKNFLRQNPEILSGIIPAEQLAGILSDEEQTQPESTTSLSDEEQARLDDATTVFEWLQTLEGQPFDQVISIIAVIRQHPEYAVHIVNFLNGNKNNQLIKA